MNDYELYDATVVDIDDEDKQGKIKIKIKPYFDGIDNDGLPWAIPFIQDSTSNTLSNDLPPINSTIRVLVSNNWKRFYYIGNRYFYNLFDFSKVSDKLSKLSNIDTEYKNLKFRLFEDNSLTFHNIKDGSHGFIQSTGSYIYFDKNGSIITSSEKDINITHKGKLEYENDGDMSITSKGKLDIKSNGLIDIANATSSLGKILKELIIDLQGLQTIGSPTNHTSPTLTTQMTTLLATLSSTFKTT